MFARDVIAPAELVPSDAQQAALADTFLNYRVYDLDLGAMTSIAQNGGELSLILGDRQFDLNLEINNIRSEGYKRYATLDDGITEVELEIPAPSQYKGTVVGVDGSIVRLSIREDRFRGYIRMPNDWIWFDPMDDHLAGSGANQVIVYRADDVISDPENSKCGMDAALHTPQARGIEMPAPAFGETQNLGLREWEVATEADGEWEDRFGQTGGLNEIEDIINDVDGIYVVENGLTVSIAFQHIWTNPNTDPFVGNDAGNNLDDLEDEWNFNSDGATRNHPRRDMVHHFSGKSFNFGVVGIAYVGVVCINNNSPFNLSLGISQDFGTNNQQIQLVAHEMGHNWSANHLDTSPCNQTCNGNDQIMCSFIQSTPNLTFASCSEGQIDDHVAAFGNLCLDP